MSISPVNNNVSFNGLFTFLPKSKKAVDLITKTAKGPGGAWGHSYDTRIQQFGKELLVGKRSNVQDGLFKAALKKLGIIEGKHYSYVPGFTLTAKQGTVPELETLSEAFKKMA